MQTHTTNCALTSRKPYHWRTHSQPLCGRWLTDASGFSAVEMVVGVQLFVILALAAVPSFSKVIQVYYLRGAAREVYSDLQNARMAAVMQNHRYRFSVIDSYTYKIHDDVNNNGAEDPDENVDVHDLRTDSPYVQLTGTGTITFAANGTAPTYATVTLSNTRGPARTATVVVGPSGRVRIN